MLIRPTVLPTPEAAALVAAHRRDKMPGIKAAEREERLDANERLKQSDKIKIAEGGRLGNSAGSTLDHRAGQFFHCTNWMD